jgi:Tfp pilus assembly protein PilO
VVRSRFTLKPSKQTCYALGGAIGLCLASGAGLYVVQTGKIATMRAEVQAARDKVENGEKVAQRLTQVEAEYAATRDKIRYLETSVSVSEYVPSLLKQVEQMGKSVSMKVDSVRPTFEPAPPPPADKEERKKWKPQPYDKVRIELQVRGSFWNVATFLYRLTEFPKILQVEKMRVDPGTQAKGAGAKPELKVDLTLIGFIFKADDKPLSLEPGAVGAAGAAGVAGAPSAGGPAGVKMPPRASISEDGQRTGGLKIKPGDPTAPRR